MSHGEIRERLDDYVDGCLTPERQAVIEAHLADCEDCRREVDFLRPLLAEARTLPPSLEPPTDLWGSIQQRIGRRRVRDHTLWSVRYQLAAAAMALLLLGSLLTVLLLRPEPVKVIATAPAVAAVPGFPAGWRETEDSYRRAAADLEEALAGAKPRLAPATVAVLERNLRIIDDAIAEARAALAADPANREVLEMLADMYAKKVDVLQQVTKLSAVL